MNPLFRYIILSIAIAVSCSGFAQQKNKIKFKADNITYDESFGKNTKRLIGNVVFEHEGVFMYCDSAYQYTEENSLDAFGKVHIEDGDSLDLYCDSLHYDGNVKVFRCKRNVVLDRGDIHLTTDYLVFDRINDLGYYTDGGKIDNRQDSSVLTSKRGYYYMESGIFYFKKDVEYVHPEFTILADTLKHEPKARHTTFLGPTDIYADSNIIHTERGFFNARTGKSLYYQNAYILSENRIITGDSIYYNTSTQTGKIRGNADILDTAEKVSVRGDVANIFQNRDSALITERAELQQYFDDDTLFMHADTFKVFGSDEKNGRTLLAFRKIRFYKSDLQGKCDSMVYAFSDSAIKMYHDPVIWSAENQITGTYIQLNMANGVLHTMDIKQEAFICSFVDSLKYNQIRGKDMEGFFVENDLDKIDVTGNGQTIYYALDEEDKFIGVNRGESSDLLITLRNNEVSEIKYINDANATFFPIGELLPRELRLKGFSWRIHIRPKSRSDIFTWVD